MIQPIRYKKGVNTMLKVER